MGQQDVWHYHLHMFLRYPDDQLYAAHGTASESEERARRSGQLREWVDRQPLGFG